ncbi:MAG: glycosyltransferase family 4 protein [Acidobacteria bacterium]|nr:glycosyltransferase family 4 protein [Acidobacteriota bacterium]
MRRILVVTSDVPLVSGGHRVIAEELARAIVRRGHLAEVVRTPQNRFGRQFTAYLANWATDVGMTGDGHAVDQIVSLRFPSYAVRHHRHVCWLNHRMREYYDLWPALRSKLSRKDLLKESIRRVLVHGADRYLLTRHVTRLYAQSNTIAAGLRRFGGIPSEVLYPPPPERLYRTEGYEPFVFAVSRLHSTKRLDLLVRAMAALESKELRAVIAGTGEEEEGLKRLAGDLGVGSRVDFVGRITDEELLAFYARCRGVFFAPLMEDYGFVTLEAFRSGKPVLTAIDSGGPAELVVDDRSGYVVPPDPKAIARRLDLWAGQADLAARMGAAGEADSRGLRWESCVDTLLS